MLSNILDEKTNTRFLDEGKRGHFRITAPINLSEEGRKNPKSIEIELMTEGSWLHPMAINGVFSVTAKRITNWVEKFKENIMGPQLPLNFSHLHNSTETPGWITNLFSKVMPNGKTSLFANLDITNESILKMIVDGSLKYISAEVDERYEETATGLTHDLVKGAALTNYPYLKNLSPISVNFEEVLKPKNESSKDFNTARKEGNKNMKDFIIDLDEDLGLLSAEDIKLAEENGIELAVPEEKGMVKVPKVKLPKQMRGASPEAKAAFLTAFNKSYIRSQDLEKATEFALKKGLAMGNTPKLEENVSSILVKLEEGMKNMFAKFTKKEEAESKTDVKLTELDAEVVLLREFKLSSQKDEDQRVVDSFKFMTPVAKGILLEMLNQGRSQIVKFEDTDISLRNLVIKFTEEMKTAPKVNLFEVISKTDVVKNEDDLNTNAIKYQKENPGTSFRVALEEVSKLKQS